MNNILLQLTEEDIVYIIGVCVVILFSIAFIGIALFYYNAKKKVIDGKLDDSEINSEIDHELNNKFIKKGKTWKDFFLYYENKKKSRSTLGKFTSGVFYVFYLLLIVFIGMAYGVKNQGDQCMWFGDTSMMIIQTNSMETANKNNTYLFDEKGNSNDDDRIKTYSFITITRDETVLSNIQVFDVCAFRMYDTTAKKNIIVVHRLIEITPDNSVEGGALYTFRGDANPSSMVNETKITKDKIVGVFKSSSFTGYKNYGLGKFFLYLQSEVGIILCCTAFILILIYMSLIDHVFDLYDDRYDQIVKDRNSEDNSKNEELANEKN
jgi:hypothetical protein